MAFFCSQKVVGGWFNGLLSFFRDDNNGWGKVQTNNNGLAWFLDWLEVSLNSDGYLKNLPATLLPLVLRCTNWFGSSTDRMT